MSFIRYALCSNPGCRYNKRYQSDMARFCPTCGEELIEKCPSCAMLIQEKGEFCQFCGKRFKPAPTPKKPKVEMA